MRLSSRPKWRTGLVGFGCAVAVVLGSGCQNATRTAGDMRAVWVTRNEYRTPEDISRVMADCADAGFNTVLFQVRGNGTAWYDSRFEPWADELGGCDPGYDPLKLACEEAHRCGLELHAWVNVMPAWRGKTPPKNPDQLYNAHPEWFWYDQHGNRQALCSFYVSLNPCLPEVRKYLVDVFYDLVSRYDVDGLHMDYIRFPNEPPATPKGSGLDYPYDARTLSLYRQDTGLAPGDDRDAWNRWRTEQVTQLVRDIRDNLKRTNPHVKLSAAVGSNRKRSLAHFRDGVGWVEEGLVDMVFPMNYKPDVEQFRAGLEMWRPYADKVAVVPGLWFARNLETSKGIDVVRRQVEEAKTTTGNFCLFSYSSLFEAKRDPGDAKPAAGGELKARRDALLPF